MYIVRKIRLYPTQEQLKILSNEVSVFNDICNYISEYAYSTSKYSIKELNNDLYYEIKSKFKLNVYSIQCAIRIVSARYMQKYSHKRDNLKPIKFNTKICMYPSNGYTIHKKYLRLSYNSSHIGIRLKYSLKGNEKYMCEPYKLKSATLIRYKNKWFLSIYVYIPTPTFIQNEDHVCVGIDTGMRFLAVTYDTFNRTVFYKSKSIITKAIRFKRLVETLRAKNTISAKRHFIKICNKAHNMLTTMCHEISSSIVKSYPPGTIFFMEDLKNLQQMPKTKNKKVGLLISHAPMYKFRQCMEYKAMLRGSLVVLVDPTNTSKTCPMCNSMNTTRSKHLLRCHDCGYYTNDDRAAAINILKKGLGVIENNYSNNNT